MTKTCDVWIAAADHERIMAHLFPGDHDEHGGQDEATARDQQTGPAGAPMADVNRQLG